MMFATSSLVYLLLGAVLIGVSLLVVVLRLAQRQNLAVLASQVLSFVALAAGVVLVVLNVQAQTPTQDPMPGQFRGTVNEVVNGDLLCYVTLTTTEGRFTVGASFDLCEPQWVGQEVDFGVAPGRVNDCESAEPCGKSQDLLLIVGMSPVR
ncbi:protein of unknown function DUF1311 [Gloeomargarita lithophora Alchichica-D10]|uniref:Uncharacterized protein n=1 Tax=Gloeomargarita lithophora Alchichica-D10 TaxID=1188229 RepID=A0A1J0ACD1_9CYAN|nr:hypothetical protein [Gloeomargarita lithophora]APB33590.1 protein of unknown function DUF1311 [Gloeomargarita lithophora Alchichica-D10]